MKLKEHARNSYQKRCNPAAARCNSAGKNSVLPDQGDLSRPMVKKTAATAMSVLPETVPVDITDAFSGGTFSSRFPLGKTTEEVLEKLKKARGGILLMTRTLARGCSVTSSFILRRPLHFSA
jgi:hypothetical protein